MNSSGPSPLRSASFVSYLAACFFNAFNDSAFQTIVALVVLRSASEESSSAILAMTAGVFVVPFLLFSAWAGALADRYSKRSVFIVMHGYELLAMSIAAYAFYVDSVPLVLAALFWTGAQSAFYSPAKYGLLPESVPVDRITRANGVLQAVTLVAIVLGTASGSFLLRLFNGSPSGASLFCLGTASLGWLCSTGVWKSPPAAPDNKVDWFNPFGDVFRTIRKHLPYAGLGAPMIGLMYFWFLGQMIKLTLLLLAKFTLYADLPLTEIELWSGILLTILAVGIGAGSLLAARWSGPKVEIGLVPLGALGISFMLLDLGLFGRTEAHVMVGVLLLGCGSGCFAVPLQSIIQVRAPAKERGAVLAASGFLTFVGVLAASGVLPGFRALGVSPSGILVVMGVFSLIVGIGLSLWLKEFFVRFLMWLLTHTIYDVRIRGRDNIPERGPALLVANHVSFADSLLIGACVQRFIRFLMLRGYYDNPAFHWVCRLMKAIPISPGLRSSTRIALAQAAGELKAGHIVCIFAEGEITRTGNLLAFRRGFEAVAREANAPIIPVHLGGVWGSIFSFEGGRIITKWPRQIPYPVTVSFGKPMPPDSTVEEVRHAVAEMGSEVMAESLEEKGTLARGFVRAARRRWFRIAVADSTGVKLPYGRFLAVSKLLADRWAGEEACIGVVLPPSAAGAIVNIAATIAGKVPVNLNFTSSQEAISSAIERCGIKKVITSRKFREKVKVSFGDAEEAFVEDLLPSIPKWKIFLTEMFMLPMPLPLLRRYVLPREPNPDSTATIIFSSGSTGLPKGVELTHSNIRANIEGLAQVFDIRPTDRILGALPFFHSFGFTATLWFPFVAGFGAAYHPNPLDPKGLGKLSGEMGATLLVATPTFASAYLRKIPEEHFHALRLTLVGAEKLPLDLGRAWRVKFGSPLLEGYGATECAPVVSVNIPRHNKEGSIGHPLPGVTIRVVDPDSGMLLKTGEEGMLQVKGPNVMKGYLGDPDRTAQVIRDGWYVTGDIGAMDRDGYVRITGRLSRFSKIAGEMVPHGRVEEALLAALAKQAGDSSIAESGVPMAVTGVPDEEKGERLVVLHAVSLDVDALTKSLRDAGLPNLWIPRRESYFRVERIPVLGTGKLDLRAVQEMARERTAGPESN